MLSRLTDRRARAQASDGLKARCASSNTRKMTARWRVFRSISLILLEPGGLGKEIAGIGAGNNSRPRRVFLLIMNYH